ncbi:type II toxin-antitoxin system HicB family antitoxin [Campylobacter sp. RM16187]|uniref:type II toxin-antitoxin system HicB family antitoxin n=1 Tax=Campylobacter sp. RM16187 TaxID=1660063 RepID=UPI0021B67D1C|nr:type II toxin-antitoxin system HicB family antitoxin [Campylobacter sp. RM16187]QKG30312.1 toxin-antitoxin system, HicB family antitoxin [Campylobacter sp. RM16187]
MKPQSKNKEYYLNLNYGMIINKEDGEFVAYYKEYPKITGCGDNEIEAIEDLKEAFSCLLDVLIAEGEEIKEPAPVEKKVRVNVILPEKLLKSISELTNNRSVFLSKAAKYAIDNKIAL